MKQFLLTLFLGLTVPYTAWCQQDSTVYVSSGPGIKHRVHFTLVINNLLITDTAKAALILKNFSDVIVKRKAVSPSKAQKKWDIRSKDFILFCRTKKGIIIDLNKMESIPKK